MANELCVCEDGLSNLGLQNCEKIMGALRKFVFTPSASYTGVLNKINPASTLNKAWVDALLNNEDKSLRLYPSPELKNITMKKDAPTMKKWDDGSEHFVTENVRKAMAILPEAPARFKAKFEAIRCNSNTAFYGIDAQGNWIGIINGTDGFLYPIPMNVKSVVAGFDFGDDKDSSQIALSFEIPSWVNDADFRMISAAKFPDFSPLTISGLLDAKVAFSNIAAGAVRATITVENNTLDVPTAVEGLVVTDFVSSVTAATSKIRNTTDNADVTITTVTEVSAGVYNLTYTLLAAKNVVVLAKLNGIDFSGMKNSSYTTV